MKDSYLIVGLGNPGAKYAKTRHNIGQMVIEYLADEYRENNVNKFKSTYFKTTIKGNDCYFQIPETYMNLSGEAVMPLMNFFKIPKENLLVIHDEIDFDFGRVQFKNGGGFAGHNGLKSIAKHFGSPNFKRLRLGIGKPDHPAFAVADYVLSNFSNDEMIDVDRFFPKFKDMIEGYVSQDFKQVMNTYNKERFNSV